MFWIALALTGLLATAVSTFARALIAQARSHARERHLLINQLLHATGKPWQPAPADSYEPDLEDDLALVDPSQLPDGDL